MGDRVAMNVATAFAVYSKQERVTRLLSPNQLVVTSGDSCPLESAKPLPGDW